MRPIFPILASLALLFTGCGGSTTSTSGGGTGGGSTTSYKVVGYYPGWGIDSITPYNAKNIVASGSAPQLTHVIYAFATIQNNQCASGNPSEDYQILLPANQTVNGIADSGSFAGNFNQLAELKAKYPNLQIEISIGGGGFDPAIFSTVSSPANVQAFVASCVNMYIKGNFASGISKPGIFTGIDVDWECPSSATDQTNFAAMLAEFRKQLDAAGSGYQLTIAAGASSWCWNYYDLPTMTKSLDFYNLMTYDFDGPWNNTTGFVAPLYQAALDPDPTNNANYAINYYLSQGVPATKIVMGMPFYAHEWTSAPTTNNGLFQTAVANQNGGNYPNIVTLQANSSYKLYRDTTSQAPWLYNSATGDFWTFDDPTSLQFKSQYVVTQKLGGVMFWDLSSDDANGTLIKALTKGLQ